MQIGVVIAGLVVLHSVSLGFNRDVLAIGAAPDHFEHVDPLCVQLRSTSNLGLPDAVSTVPLRWRRWVRVPIKWHRGSWGYGKKTPAMPPPPIDFPSAILTALDTPESRQEVCLGNFGREPDTKYPRYRQLVNATVLLRNEFSQPKSSRGVHLCQHGVLRYFRETYASYLTNVVAQLRPERIHFAGNDDRPKGMLRSEHVHSLLQGVGSRWSSILWIDAQSSNCASPSSLKGGSCRGALAKLLCLESLLDDEAAGHTVKFVMVTRPDLFYHFPLRMGIEDFLASNELHWSLNVSPFRYSTLTDPRLYPTQMITLNTASMATDQAVVHHLVTFRRDHSAVADPVIMGSFGIARKLLLHYSTTSNKFGWMSATGEGHFGRFVRWAGLQPNVVSVDLFITLWRGYKRLRKELIDDVPKDRISYQESTKSLTVHYEVMYCYSYELHPVSESDMLELNETRSCDNQHGAYVLRRLAVQPVPESVCDEILRHPVNELTVCTPNTYFWTYERKGCSDHIILLHPSGHCMDPSAALKPQFSDNALASKRLSLVWLRL